MAPTEGRVARRWGCRRGTPGIMEPANVELVQEIGRRTTVITEDSRETTFLFQRLSVAQQRGNAVSFLGTFPARLVSRCSHFTTF